MSESLCIGHTRSLCPVCLISLPAELRRKGDRIYLWRTCPKHGSFSGLIWRGEPDIETWRRPKKPSLSVRRQTERALGCPHDCGRCPDHGQHACTVLFEITSHCNLRCPVCFADAGSGDERAPGSFTPLEELFAQMRWIREQAGEIVLQISGGEPTLHPCLPELVAKARRLFPAVQLNTNGLKLAENGDLAKSLAKAGLSWVFLQFDGTDDAIFTALRGRPLLRQKLAAIDACKQAGLSVVLVPTVASGINDHDLGNLLRLGISLAPTVRGLHLQPMTASGRNALAGSAPPLTLPEVLQAICSQSNGQMRPEHAAPPGCEHERCSFHCRYRLSPSGALLPLRGETPCCGLPGMEDEKHNRASASAKPLCRAPAPFSPLQEGCCLPGEDAQPPAGESRDAAVPGQDAALAGARRAIDTIMRVWQSPEEAADESEDAFDAFIRQTRDRLFSVTCMAFQDARNVDIARLKGCCVHIYAPPARLIPFCAYNMTSLDGVPLHRGAALLKDAVKGSCRHAAKGE